MLLTKGTEVLPAPAAAFFGPFTFIVEHIPRHVPESDAPAPTIPNLPLPLPFPLPFPFLPLFLRGGELDPDRPDDWDPRPRPLRRPPRPRAISSGENSCT